MSELSSGGVPSRSGARGGVAERLGEALCLVLGTDEVPVRLRAWDGSEAGPVGGPVVVVRSRRALRRLAWAPGELGLGRAFVAGEIDVEGDLFEALAAFTGLTSAGRPEGAPKTLEARDRLRLAGIAARLGAVGPEPAPPPEEIEMRRRGLRHSKSRDAAAISHHYDVGNTFYRLVLGPSMVYSCAVWADQDTGLDAAQEAKLDLVCRKLGLRPGMRLLDIGCGWGSMALHAAQEYGVDVVGVTLSIEQATLARKRVAEAGLTDRIDIRVQDYRDIDDGPFDAISSIGMAEHVGRHQMAAYTARLHELVRPGGRVLNHAIAWSAGETTWDNDTFISRYVFPDGELLRLGDTVSAIEATGLEVLDVEALRQHYALTLRAWTRLLEENWSAAVKETSEGRARVWRLYMAASALSFEAGALGVNQVLAQRRGGEAPPLRRDAWT
ncbi:class I SAM-dependent methyltransferase [Blastococcus sp. URHD0036]|uniref:class I SAM-dependent methyltransferase n=1 Tax=Blastococcus sp. URHD0036 TaxID=1380356 RepID=UPI00068C58F1|nr:class I SAM-dependent methyltransferase [Blastococcus sp. URHD0036]